MSKVRKALGSLHLSNFILKYYLSLIFFSFNVARSIEISPKHVIYFPFVPIMIITI